MMETGVLQMLWPVLPSFSRGAARSGESKDAPNAQVASRTARTV
jgi:hypothetical protein